MIMFDNRLGYHTCILKGSTEVGITSTQQSTS